MSYQKLLEKYPLISDQVNKTELAVILRELERVLAQNIPGDIVELGCYEGTTSLFLQRLLREQNATKILHVYDSFEGLPPKTGQDTSGAGEQFKAGELNASKQRLIREFKHAGLIPPVIHKGWFSNLSASDMPEKIAFAFLDGDFYSSIIDSLRVVWPHMTSGAVVAIDDYQREALPGVKRAVDDFFVGQDIKIQHQASIAIIHKR
jgi:O-methyltransferase